MPNSRRGFPRILLMALVSTSIDITTYYLLERGDLSQAARTAVAFLPLPPDLILLAMILSRIRKLDEFQRRIQLEAVAVGFLATGVAVFAYSFLQKAGIVGPLTMVLVWSFMLMFYGVGYLMAVKRYQ